MPATIETITSDALMLSETDRAHLAQTLLRSLEPAEGDIEQAWTSEVGRRLEQVHNGTATGRPAEEVFRDIRERIRR